MDEDMTMADVQNLDLDLLTSRELDEVATIILRSDVRDGHQIRGKDPILFEEHLRNRYRREIYNREGVPDPGIVQGIFNRIHPDGRKVNTDKQRKEYGASFYR